MAFWQPDPGSAQVPFFPSPLPHTRTGVTTRPVLFTETTQAPPPPLSAEAVDSVVSWKPDPGSAQVSQSSHRHARTRGRLCQSRVLGSRRGEHSLSTAQRDGERAGATRRRLERGGRAAARAGSNESGSVSGGVWLSPVTAPFKFKVETDWPLVDKTGLGGVWHHVPLRVRWIAKKPCQIS